VAGAEDTVEETTGLRQIGEVAELAGLSLRTVRYYEEMELVAPHTRTEGGFRLYTDEQIERLQLIKRMKPLGFTVQEMRDLLDARDTLRLPEASDADREAARERLSQFAGTAAERSDELRRKAENAAELVEQLRGESRRRRKARR
jgi:DNA-binding transcriptional MerR regulator